MYYKTIIVILSGILLCALVPSLSLAQDSSSIRNVISASSNSGGNSAGSGGEVVGSEHTLMYVETEIDGEIVEHIELSDVPLPYEKTVVVDDSEKNNHIETSIVLSSERVSSEIGSSDADDEDPRETVAAESSAEEGEPTFFNLLTGFIFHVFSFFTA